MFTIIGPGAVGGLLSALMARAGVEHTVVARPQTVARLNRDGITVKSELYGDFHVPVKASVEIPQGCSVLLTVKSYALPDVIPQIVAARPKRVISLLNGLAHIDVLHRELDHISEVVCGTSRVVVNRNQDFEIVHSSDYNEVAVPKTAAEWPLVDALNLAGITVFREGDENTVVWRKFHFLMAMALLTGWTDKPMGPALREDPALTEAFLDELAMLATASGFPVTGAEILAKLERVDSNATSSFRTDLRAGGLTEIATLGVEPLRLAQEKGLSLPTIAKVVADLQERGA